jgi:hypothetical protein
MGVGCVAGAFFRAVSISGTLWDLKHFPFYYGVADAGYVQPVLGRRLRQAQL